MPKRNRRLREIQEALAEGELLVGDFLSSARAPIAAAANRLDRLVDQYPLYSRADEALWEEADSYEKMGGKDHRFKREEIAAYSRIVRDYPLEYRVEDAKKKLTALETADSGSRSQPLSRA